MNTEYVRYQRSIHTFSRASSEIFCKKHTHKSRVNHLTSEKSELKLQTHFARDNQPHSKLSKWVAMDLISGSDCLAEVKQPTFQQCLYIMKLPKNLQGGNLSLWKMIPNVNRTKLPFQDVIRGAPSTPFIFYLTRIFFFVLPALEGFAISLLRGMVTNTCWYHSNHLKLNPPDRNVHFYPTFLCVCENKVVFSRWYTYFCTCTPIRVDQVFVQKH